MEKNCVKKRGDITTGSVMQEQFGEWLRVMSVSKSSCQSREKTTASTAKVRPSNREIPEGGRDEGSRNYARRELLCDQPK